MSFAVKPIMNKSIEIIAWPLFAHSFFDDLERRFLQWGGKNHGSYL
jgi:hypothetical protein